MNNIQSNIHNLTQLWTVAGEAFQSYFEDEYLCISTIKNSDWPNRIWTKRPLSEDIFEKIQAKMKAEAPLTFSYFNENNSANPLLQNSPLQIKTKQYAMSLALTKQMETQKNIQLQQVSNEAEAALWSSTFYEAFKYKISPETVSKTQEKIQYFLAYHNEISVGTIVVFITNQVAGIHSLSILPSQRKQGFATELMHHALNMLTAQGFALATLQASEMAKEMYLQMGFSIEFTVENYITKTA